MSKWQFVKDYLQHRLTAGNRHGLHSPFVYRLVDKVIYDYKPKKVYNDIENYRKQLLYDDTENSKINKPKIDQLIYRITADMHPESISEIGKISAVKSLYLKSAVPNARFYFCDTIAKMCELPRLDLVIVNMDDQQETIPGHFNLCLSKMHQNSLLIFTDIYRSAKTKLTWAEIKAHPDVTATVDLFWIGLVYFKKGMVKQDFKIRL